METKCGAWRQNGGKLGDVTEAGRPVLRGLEVILQILRFGDHFYGDHGASAPPPYLNPASNINIQPVNNGNLDSAISGTY